MALVWRASSVRWLTRVITTAARIARITMTTSSSISVNARVAVLAIREARLSFGNAIIWVSSNSTILFDKCVGFENGQQDRQDDESDERSHQEHDDRLDETRQTPHRVVDLEIERIGRADE